MQNINKEISFNPDAISRPPSKSVKTSLPEIPGNISDINPQLNTDFEENFPFQEVVISEIYQRPDMTFCKNLKNWKVLLMQAGWCRNFYLSKLT